MKIASANSMCEKCGAVGEEVHRIVHLTPENIHDPEVTVNQKNLILLCKECRNKEHHRFGGKREYSFDENGDLAPENIAKKEIALLQYFFEK